jgi:hypothetical protein
MTRFTHTTQQLVENFDFSLSTLRRHVKNKILLPGRHYLPISIGKKSPQFNWDPQEVLNTLDLNSKRSIIK